MSVNLPNTITSIRVALAPVVALLLLGQTFHSRLLAFLVFVLAGISDLWDGQLARRRGQITNFGKIVDPVADKLLVLATARGRDHDIEVRGRQARNGGAG